MEVYGMEKSSEFKKLKCKKEFGLWFYKKVDGGDLDAPIYELYTEDKKFECTFGCYVDMKYYLETGIVL